jgi:hypothetical protein
MSGDLKVFASKIDLPVITSPALEVPRTEECWESDVEVSREESLAQLDRLCRHMWDKHFEDMEAKKVVSRCEQFERLSPERPSPDQWKSSGRKPPAPVTRNVVSRCGQFGKSFSERPSPDQWKSSDMHQPTISSGRSQIAVLPVAAVANRNRIEMSGVLRTEAQRLREQADRMDSYANHLDRVNGSLSNML